MGEQIQLANNIEREENEWTHESKDAIQIGRWIQNHRIKTGIA